MVELQIETGVQNRNVDKLEDLADLIRGLHRSVALKPAKKKESACVNYQMHGTVEKGKRSVIAPLRDTYHPSPLDNIEIQFPPHLRYRRKSAVSRGFRVRIGYAVSTKL